MHLLVDEIHLVVEQEDHNLTELVNRDLLQGEAEDDLCSAEVEAVYMGASFGAAGRQMKIEVLVQIDTYEMHLELADHSSCVENEVVLFACAPLMKHNCFSGWRMGSHNMMPLRWIHVEIVHIQPDV